jgi:uncharacterized protein (TIGR00661 family)
MKILYAIQGTGNGHISRAREIIPVLQKKGAVDILLSGVQVDLEPGFPVKYRLEGLSFIFGKKGGVDIWETIKNYNFKQLRKEIRSIPVENYDLVINDFEPVSAWACYLKGKPCISLSHQIAVSDVRSPRPTQNNWLGSFLLKHYAPSSDFYGFHFQSYNQKIFTPVIRAEVRVQQVSDLGHYTVYLPSYSDEQIIAVLGQIKQARWHVFSKHSHIEKVADNVFIFPISNEKFIQSMASSSGVLCGAGFETPAEALFLGKKIMVVPMFNQLEQLCNATALKEMGVPVIKILKLKNAGSVLYWLNHEQKIQVSYPDQTEEIIELIFSQYSPKTELEIIKPAFALGRLRYNLLKALLL